jgi:hypothetical protein
MMGLRLKEGIDLSIPKNKSAYLHFKDKLVDIKIKRNHLYTSNINLLDNVLEKLI